MQCSLWLGRPHCSFRAGATSEGWKGSCQGGSLPGRAVRRGAQSCRDASNHSYTQVLSLRAWMPLCKQERMGPTAFLWEVLSTAHSQNCTLDRCFSVSVLPKNYWEMGVGSGSGPVPAVFSVHEQKCHWGEAEQIVWYLTRTITTPQGPLLQHFISIFHPQMQLAVTPLSFPGAWAGM